MRSMKLMICHRSGCDSGLPSPGASPHLHLINPSAAAFKPRLFHHSLPDFSTSHSGMSSLSHSLVKWVIFSNVVLSNCLLLCLDRLPTTITPRTVFFTTSLQPLHLPHAACPLPSIQPITLLPFTINPLNYAPIFVSLLGPPKNYIMITTVLQVLP